MPDPVPAPAAPAAPAAPVAPVEPAAPAAPGAVPAVVLPAPVAPEYPAIAKIVPPEFKDKTWVSEIKDIPALFKKVDFLQTKIGERPAGIPQDTAPKEEWDKFYLSFGRPTEAKGYAFGAVPEGLKVDDNFQTEIKGVMFEAGVNTKQAKILEEGYNKLLLKSVETQKAASGDLDKKFDEMVLKAFGDKKDRALVVAKALIAKHTPAEMKPYVEGLSNEALVVLASTLNGVATTYIKEDQLPPGGAGVGPQSLAEKQTEGRRLMATEAYTNPFHVEHEATVAKVRELYGTNT